MSRPPGDGSEWTPWILRQDPDNGSEFVTGNAEANRSSGSATHGADTGSVPVGPGHCEGADALPYIEAVQTSHLGAVPGNFTETSQVPLQHQIVGPDWTMNTETFVADDARPDPTSTSAASISLSGPTDTKYLALLQ